VFRLSPVYPLVNMKFRFNNSAHAMLFNGTRSVFLLPKAMHVTMFSLLNSSFIISESRTFTITEPSFKCRFTFLPRKDRAVFTPKPSISSPLLILFCQFAPALLADWFSFSSENDVQFNIVVFAFPVPRVLTSFHNREPPLLKAIQCIVFCAFKAHLETTLTKEGEAG